MENAIINPQKGLKTFVFEREDTQQSILVEQQVDLQSDPINLSYLFSLYAPLSQNKVSVYDPDSSRFVSLAKIGAGSGYLPQRFLQPSFILIRYLRGVEYGSESDSMDSSLEGESRGGESRGGEKKDSRSKQRTIAQVIELVKKWRDLHLYGHKTIRRRLNLQDAARIVGISKKSLDDYYCQLRLGELYNFDFVGNLNEKMGVLRTYVKNYRPEKESKKRQNEKHPKNLRIINQFDVETKQLRLWSGQEEMREGESEREMELELMDPMLNRGISRGENENENEMREQNLQREEVRSVRSQSSPIYKQLFTLQNQFFKQFQLDFDEQIDPYFQVGRDFRKKDFSLDSDSFLLFD